MCRAFILIALVVLLAGCSRYSTRAQGPFAKRPQAQQPASVIPPGPAPNSSPLAMGPVINPEPPRPPDDRLALPPRPPEPGALPPPVAGEVVPAGGVETDAAAFPPRQRPKRNDPPPLPSPFAPKPPTASTPVPPDANRHVAEVKKLVEAAAAKWAKVNTYEAVVTRRELAPNKKMNEDVVLYQFRKEPMAVYLRNLDEANQPREIIYTRAEDKIHTIVGKADATVLFKVGAKAPVVSPDFPMVKDKTRYSIREAGFGTPIARVRSWVEKVESGKLPADALTYLGEVNRKEYPYPLLGVQLKLRPGDDPLMPNGGMRQWFFDPKPDSGSYAWPVLIIATEPNGKEVEYYLFEKLKLDVPLTDADFDPARFGKKR